VPYNQIAILARTNKLPDPAVHILIQRGIPLALRGGVEAFSEYEVRLLLTAIAISSEQKTDNIWALRLNPGLYGFSQKLVGEDWSRRVKALTTYIQKRPPKGLSDEDQEAREANFARHRDKILSFDDGASLFGFLKTLLDSKDDGDRVFVGTIHSAKGLEWDTVFVMGWEDGVLPQRQSSLPRVLEEEKRIAYVAITRAKNFMMLSSARNRGNRENDISPFLAEMGFLEESEPKAEAAPPPGKLVSDSGKAREEFLSRYPRREMSPEERREWRRHLKELRLAAEKKENDRIADGEGGDGSGWSDQAAGTGLLAEAGYTVRKDGPFAQKRHDILADVLHGRIQLPDWLSETVQSQWGVPNTRDRFTKIRNTINVALGNQKGRQNASRQAMEKWEADLVFLDQTLLPQLIAEADS